MPFLPLAGMILVMLSVIGSIMLARAQASANDWVRHTLEVEVRIGEVLELVRTVESNHRGFLIAGNRSFTEDMETTIAKLRGAVAALHRQTIDNPAQQRSLVRLDALIASKIAFARTGAELVLRDRRGDAIRLVDLGSGQALMRSIDALLLKMKTVEQRLLERRIANVQLAVWWLVAGQVAAILLVLLVAALIIREARIRFVAVEAARDEATAAAEATTREMAARETAEGQLRQLQKMESIGQLTGGIAHDFNNMLAIVIGSLDMAKRRSDDHERVAKCIDNAREGAERAAALTARLLAFSRQQPLAPVPIDANKLVSGMSDLLRRTLGEQISVETVLSGGLWRTYADPSQLENAVLNLAVNARDAIVSTGQEGGRLTIETNNAHLDDDYARDRNEVEPGQYVLICVSDTGGGMTPDIIERAFDPFFTTKEVGKGTGLGLSQVFGFVKQSGGHIAIYSEPGEGTTVKLYLPRFTGPVIGPRAATPVEAMPEGRADEIILVVEDEQRVRHFSVDALRELGYTAMSAANGQEALRLLAENPSILLLFTDVVMPEMNGRRLAEEARAIRPGLPVLYTTGYTRNAVVHNGMLDTGVAFLPKPFTIEQLARKVREVIDGGGANR
ncbi:CHASE3 domain-containing protein [Sphingomonas profundi]|uniref:CHASE3 domain-containing protein n=1 Tax=Alterirhizorhabdus profundi TaxID=2681549 RepID=UPI001E4D60E5|nr:CHASE3 domain-containing protein [Sphingomonas profundi]